MQMKFCQLTLKENYQLVGSSSLQSATEVMKYLKIRRW